MVRAADHRKPLITANYSFVPPIEREIEDLSQRQPVPDRFLDLLEEIPTSYLAIYNDFFSVEERRAIEDLLTRGIVSGRLRFIKSFDAGAHAASVGRDDLYAVTSTEPHARGDGAALPFSILPSNPKSFKPDGLTQAAIFIIRFYRVAYGRVPQFSEFTNDLAQLGGKPDPGSVLHVSDEKKREFAEVWLQSQDFHGQHSKESDEQFLDKLFANGGWQTRKAKREEFLYELQSHSTTREAVFRAIVEDPALPTGELNAAFVASHYFLYLHRNPDAQGYNYWLKILSSTSNYDGVTQAFANSSEHLQTSARHNTSETTAPKTQP
jgi:hypothetical protein